MAEIELPPESQRHLITIARATLTAFVAGCSNSDLANDDPHLEDNHYGVFVSLFKGSELRGCIGICEPSESLRQLVVEMTKAAASRDPRVMPIQPWELDDIVIDISVLSPLERIADPLDLEIGRHGLHIRGKQRRGVLLPQVAAERGWDTMTFLRQTCLKANLPTEAWRLPTTEVSRFTALVIEEQQ